MSAKISYNLIYNSIGAKLSPKPEQVLRDEKSEVLPIKKLLVENLEFAFPGQVPVFQNINLTAELGRITVVFGATGSGKSLMVSVLNRLLPLQKGEIIINGYNWLKISDYEWREISSSLMQPVHIFKDDEMFSFCMELLHKLKNEMVSIIFTGSNRIKSKEDNFLVCKMINYN